MGQRCTKEEAVCMLKSDLQINDLSIISNDSKERTNAKQFSAVVSYF